LPLLAVILPAPTVRITAFRRSQKNGAAVPGENFPPEQVIAAAQENNLPSISYTYVEPTIFSEYALDTMKLARNAGLKNIWVSNGFMSSECRQMIFPFLDADNIDIKSFPMNFIKITAAAACKQCWIQRLRQKKPVFGWKSPRSLFQH